MQVVVSAARDLRGLGHDEVQRRILPIGDVCTGRHRSTLGTALNVATCSVTTRARCKVAFETAGNN